MATFTKNNLPSGLLPYSFKHVEMEPFKVNEIMKLSKARSLQSVAPMVDALNDVVSCDANDLTDGDFYYLLAFQRLNAYTSSPMIVQWECEGIVFQEQSGLQRRFNNEQLKKLVEEYDNASEERKEELEDPNELVVESVICGEYNEQQVGFNDLIVQRLEENQVIDERLDYPRIRTLPQGIAKSEDPELRHVIQAARWLKKGDNLDEKLELLRNSDNLELFETAYRTEMTVRHGVSNVVLKECPKCGVLSKHVFDITPETFFDL
mgnify:CR=1 FL=1